MGLDLNHKLEELGIERSLGLGQAHDDHNTPSLAVPSTTAKNCHLLRASSSSRPRVRQFL